MLAKASERRVGLGRIGVENVLAADDQRPEDWRREAPFETGADRQTRRFARLSLFNIWPRIAGFIDSRRGDADRNVGKKRPGVVTEPEAQALGHRRVDDVR